MYTLQSVTINGFWKRLKAECSFNNDVTIVIGRNGTGKTTFMNILHAVLAVELENINDNDFSSVEIKLKEKNKIKTIKVNKHDNVLKSFPSFEYQISNKKYSVHAIGDDRRYPYSMKRRYQQEVEVLKAELNKLVSLSSLSVYRLRSGEDLEIRDISGVKFINPVDYRLNQLLLNLTKYQLDLTQKAREVALDLQKEVLASILYSQEDSEDRHFKWRFNKDEERKNLISAYTQLNAIDNEIKKKINYHVETIDKTFQEINNKTKKNDTIAIDYSSLEALRKTQRIITMSLKAEDKTREIFSPIVLFLETLQEFIIDKKFTFTSGELSINNAHGKITHHNLSSGEKQLLILFIETLLQQSQTYIYLTDEPELSLHIAWQKNIIPAIKKLNPNAQVIAATHSPEVASKYRGSIFDMEKLVHG
ncbi:AAA family ATPase [Pantoea sp. FN0302]|uniref:AAA family ATPase n=2 Tax=Erwiniaceae TaxID=1903409 RepID=UPI003CEB2828